MFNQGILTVLLTRNYKYRIIIPNIALSFLKRSSYFLLFKTLLYFIFIYTYIVYKKIKNWDKYKKKQALAKFLWFLLPGFYERKKTRSNTRKKLAGMNRETNTDETITIILSWFLVQKKSARARIYQKGVTE